MEEDLFNFIFVLFIGKGDRLKYESYGGFKFIFLWERIIEWFAGHGGIWIHVHVNHLRS